MKKLIFILLLFPVLHLSAGTGKYRLVLTGDPATTITIGWNQISGTNPVVYYDTVDHGTNYSQYAFSKDVDRSVYYRGMNNKFARITGLLPATAYYFVIHDSQGTSDRYWFKTAPADMSRLSIIAGGDSRTNRTPRQRANLLVSKLKPHAVLFGGDMTEDDSDIQWKNWMDDWQYTIANDGRMFPIIPTMGNHETNEVVYNLFDTPDDSYYYAITFGNNLIRIYSLNTEISMSGNQLIWLQTDLENHQNVIWKAAQYHKPMRPHYNGKPENEAAYDAWAQLFFDNNVRLVVECDAHTVKETWPVMPSSFPGNDEGFVQNDTYGTVYIGEGGWGAPLRDNNDNKSWTRASGKFYQFKLIFVDESNIEVRTIKTDNANTVGEVSNDDPFTLPDNLDVWAPANGEVVEITPAPPMNKPGIHFPDGTPVVYTSGENITLEVEVVNQGNGIDNVTFYIDNVQQEIITAPPYSFTHSYPDGMYEITAVANDGQGLFDIEKIYINVGTFSKTIELPVKNGQDDVEETEAGAVYFGSSDLEMVYDDYDFIPGVENGFQKIGLRFQSAFIPNGAVIDNAYIQFRSDETDSEFTELLLYAENTANALPFDNGDVLSVSARDVFPDSVYWTPPAWTSTGQTGPAQQTPPLTELLQQVINNEDWKPGNSIVFKVVGTGVSLVNGNALRVADSWEGKPEHPPTLVCSFSFDATNTGYADNNKTDNILYPNPFGNNLNLSLPGYSESILVIKLINSQGVSILSQKRVCNNGKIRIPAATVPPGIYIIEAIDMEGNIVFRSKAVKQ